MPVLPARVVGEYLAWLVLAAFFYGFSFQFADPSNRETISPEVWPRFFALMVAVVATLHAIDEARRWRAGPAKPREPLEIGALAAMLAAPIAFVLLMPRIGFHLAMPLFLAGQLFALGERRWWLIVAIALGVGAAISVAFTALFYVALPVGVWPGFGAINGAFVELLR